MPKSSIDDEAFEIARAVDPEVTAHTWYDLPENLSGIDKAMWRRVAEFTINRYGKGK